MRFLSLFFLLIGLTSAVVRSEEPTEPTKVEELSELVGKEIILTGIYHNPGKGSRSIDCGFIRLNINDYSFYTKDAQGHLVTDLKNGEKIRFKAKLTHFKGSKSLVASHPVLQEALPPTQVIDGSMVKIYAWYDNECGYSKRMAELCHIVAARYIAGVEPVFKYE